MRVVCDYLRRIADANIIVIAVATVGFAFADTLIIDEDVSLSYPDDIAKLFL
jgi:hypothetical protein